MRTLPLIALLFAGGAEAMIYRPPAPLAMWDTWVFRDGDEYHLFFLQSRPPQTWDTIGRAVSRDLVHWTALPPIPTKGPDGAWDEPPTLTGSTVRDGERVWTFYGSAPDGVQSIGAMIWDGNLRGWVKHPDNPLLVSRPPHYSGVDWRDLSVYREADGTWFGFVCAQAGGQAARLPLRDKTLVAWITVGDLDARGGSVITVMDPREQRFDALVYGERAARRWMPGSELFHRTPSAETIAGWPAESAAPDELVQLAAVYRGRRVTIYRNGVEQGTHEVAEPLALDVEVAVTIGLRHLGAAPENAWFTGTIDDARVYDRPLSAEQLAALRPNQPSDPAPVVWFDFAGDRPVDRAGALPDGILHGGARIEGGRLHLPAPGAYLQAPANPGGHAAVAYLTSRDLSHWEYHPPAFTSPAFGNMEVPDYFVLGEWHYLTFASSWTVRDVGGRQRATGGWYVMARDRLGPYHEPPNPLLLPSGNGRLDNYVGRTLDHPDGRLLYHHTVGGDVCWAEPKLIHQHADGTLDLRWWPRLSALETELQVDNLAAELAGDGIQPLEVAARDLMITGRITVERGSAGFTWRRSADGAVAVRLDPAEASVTVETRDADGAHLVDRIVGPATPGSHELRVMVRAHRVSIYLDEVWLFGLSLPDGPTGDGAALWTDGAARFEGVRVVGLDAVD